MLAEAVGGMMEGVNNSVSLLRRNSEVLKGYVHDCGLLANCVRQINYTLLEPDQQRMLRELVDETTPEHASSVAGYEFEPDPSTILETPRSTRGRGFPGSYWIARSRSGSARSYSFFTPYANARFRYASANHGLNSMALVKSAIASSFRFCSRKALPRSS